MKHTMRANVLSFVLLAGAVLAARQVQAQVAPEKARPPAAVDEVRAYFELLRSDFNTAKIATINTAMKLTGPEAEKFWPIYREYENELAAVGERKVVLIREFAGHHFAGTLDDKAANEIAEHWMKNTQDRLNLWKKYHKRIGKAVSPIRAAQFLQLENQIALFIDVSIASEMPQVGTGTR